MRELKPLDRGSGSDLGAGAKGPWSPPLKEKPPTSGPILYYLSPVSFVDLQYTYLPSPHSISDADIPFVIFYRMHVPAQHAKNPQF